MHAISETNPLLLTDSYKVSHWKQYPVGTSRVFSFFESRGGEFDSVTFFGLQYLLKRYFEDVVITQDMIDEAAEEFALHFGDATLFNRAGFEYIRKAHGGRLPLSIKAVPEGLTVPTGNVLMTIENTDSNLPWLTNYAETLLSQVWYPSTVCTLSRAMRSVVMHWLSVTGDPSLIDFKVHDFGFRGSTSVESAGIGGAAHLVNFRGTDTLQALRVARKYYGERMAGHSIPAAEHSTITSWGREHEVDAFRNMLTQFPTGLVAVVSDSFNVYDACRNLWGKELRNEVLERDGMLIVRPDSGPPPFVVMKVLETLGDAFGTETNAKGYKVLNPKVRVIQGDGIDLGMLDHVLCVTADYGWSADNLAFGSGGGLLQKVDRDTQKFAFKCSAIERSGVWHDVMKDPVTDPGKRSKAGRLTLIKTEDGYATKRIQETGLDRDTIVLKEVFRDGKLLINQDFAAIRANALL